MNHFSFLNHISQRNLYLDTHIPNNDKRFPCHDMAMCYDFGTTDEPKWFVDEILAHRWVDRAHLGWNSRCAGHWEMSRGNPLLSARSLKL